MNSVILQRSFVLLMLLAAPIFTHAQRTKEKPNVIVILTDDQGSLDLGIYGSDDLATPHTDQLAKEGVRFTQFYAGAPVCSPSRAALLTGKTNLRAGLPNNVPVPERADETGQYGLPNDQVTIAEILKEQDYYTALIGKWHLGHRPQNLPNAQGFDYFFGHQRGCIDNYSHFFFWDGPNVHDLYRNDTEVNCAGEFFADLMVDEIKNIIDQKQQEPFFIYWAWNAPHYPYQGTQKWLEYYKDMPSPRKEYAAFMSTADESIGQVLEYLEEKGMAENTIVIFQSDHGHSKEERALWGGGNAGPYRGSKFSLFEGGLRVPAIIRYPGVIPAGEVRDQLTLSQDWIATVAELTGAKAPRDIEGRSLMPIIKNPRQETPHKQVHWQVGNYRAEDSQWAIRQGPWKLIGNVQEPMAPGETRTELPELFLANLDQDVSEKENLADKHPEKVKELFEKHQAWLKKVRKEMDIRD